MITVLLAEEKQIVRRGIRMRLALESDIAIVAETEDGWGALQLVREHSPQVVVTGIRLSGLDGFQLTERLSRKIPDCTVVILSLYDDLQTQKRASQAGASFVVSKLESDDKLIAAIRSTSTKT
ncbi:MAG TPA: response regulator transcription factor [Anaerolineales bacterium]|nr:response regulator transcription factor [Anaerolineales bacterium]